jgi:hypothetical protein
VSTLKEVLLRGFSYESQWGIWAEKIDGEFRPESQYRFGQFWFENGGVLDNFECVGSNERLEDAIQACVEDTRRAIGEDDWSAWSKEDGFLVAQREQAIDYLFEIGHFDKDYPKGRPVSPG